jgi:hypothetical protein
MIQRQPDDCLSSDVVKDRLNARVPALDFRPADSVRRRPPAKQVRGAAAASAASMLYGSLQKTRKAAATAAVG